MSQQVEVLALPFLACLILTGIHAYLGIHVISRKVIFVDIALAQIAALGATLAFLLGHDPRSEGAYWFSLGFAVLAAAVFALTRTREERVPQEAIIGLAYAVAAATSILLADISPHGAEHLKDLLAGSIVWVTPHQILKTGILYAAIGAFHFVFRKTFLLISMNPEEAYARGIRVRLWDFLFYLSFGIVITSSVQIAGVLLVFCYLVAPAVFAVMFSDALKVRLTLGWAIGSLVSAVGLLFSYDRPSGPTIMVCFAAALIIGGVVRAVARAPFRPRTAMLVTGAAALILLAGYALLHLAGGPPEDDHSHGGDSAHAEEAAHEQSAAHTIGGSLEDLRLALRDSHPAVRALAIAELAGAGDRGAVAQILQALEDPSTAVRESAARALGKVGGREAWRALEEATGREDEDEWVRLYAAESACLIGDAAGIPALIELARSGQARLARLQALETAARLAGMGEAAESLGSDPEAPRARALIGDLDRWWEEHGTRLLWVPAHGVYRPDAARP